MSTPETTSDAGPEQVGTIDEATLAAAKAAGISLAPDPNAVVEENTAENDDSGDGATDEQAERPSWLPEKFKSVEDMAKAYAELEKAQGGKPKDEPAKEGEAAPKSEAVEQAKGIVEKAGLEWSKLNEEWTAGDGKLSDASYKAFADQGVSKDLVDGFINGQNAINASKVNVVRTAAFEASGGEAKYMEAIKWASDGWSPAEIKAFDTAVSGTDTAAVKLAVGGLMAAYAKSGGTEPTNLARTGRATSGTYANIEQVIADMSKPAYENDPAFRKRVEDRLARSNF